MRFNVPFYAQSSEFTCGPACILMVFQFFRRRRKPSRSLEFEVWRQCNMIGAKGADPFGLSVPLLDAGHRVHLATRDKKTVNLDLWKRRPRENPLSTEGLRLARFGMAENRKRALRRGLTVEHTALTVERIERSFSEGFLPVALVHMGLVHQLDIPHWVVVTEMGENEIRFNDPYLPGGGKDTSVPREGFQKMLDDIGTRIGLSPSVLFVEDGEPPERPT